MAIKATVERQFTYGINKQLVTNKVSETVFPFHFELDDEVLNQVESYWRGCSEVADYEHDGMQSVLTYELGVVMIFTYEEVV